MSMQDKQAKLSRRDFLKALFTGGAMVTTSAAVGSGLLEAGNAIRTPLKGLTGPPPQDGGRGHSHGGGDPHHAMGPVGTVSAESAGVDPLAYLQEFDFGEVSQLENGQTLREYRIVAIDREIEVAPGVFFPAWTYNGKVPGPTLRCTEGDRIKIEFFNGGTHPHTIHFHGIHSASMDGVPNSGAGIIHPGESTIYEFDAAPFGCHLYHCHALPLKRHIHKGLYGAFIIDPDPENYQGEEREVAKSRNPDYPEYESVNEMVMVMNGFDTNFDGDNEIYAVNSTAFAYMNEPIRIRSDQRQRLYLVNITEFDPINSIHIHANFFDYYDHGTTLTPTLKTVDTIMQCQAQRGILEFSFEGFEPGLYMFHAHQSEFAELGWMGFFEVQ
ncbi:MAG: multicopper oxidase domain-containing protein [Anaerolineales bacterium]|nr:multicopper oxidase domain-containing protein [Anaerolineales bacterium]